MKQKQKRRFRLPLFYFTRVSRDPCCRSFSHAAGDESSYDNELIIKLFNLSILQRQDSV